MSREETEYFETINNLVVAKGAEEKDYYKNKLKELQSNRPKNSARVGLASFFSEWYFPAVLVAADRCPREALLDRISKIVPISSDEIQRILKLCFQEDLLREQDGLVVLDSSHQIFFDMKSASLKHKKYLKEQIQISARMIDQSYEKGGKFFAHTFTIQDDDLNYYYEKIRSLLAELTARSDNTAPDKVMQLSIQLFNVDSKMKV